MAPRCKGGMAGTGGKVALVLVLLSVAVAGCLAGDRDDGPDPPPGPGSERPDSGSLPADIGLAQTGRWLAPFEAEVPAINMVLLHDGRVLYWSGVEARGSDGASDWTFFTSYPQEGESRILDLSGDQPLIITPELPDGGAADLFCAGAVQLPDGRVLTIGSSDWHTLPDSTTLFLSGGRDARIFDPATDAWSVAGQMILGRWYPSIIRDAEGAPLAVSGIQDLAVWDDIWREWETWDADQDEWSKVPGIEALLPLYPRIHLVPGGPLKGEVFYNTVATLWGPFGWHPEQPTWSYQKSFNVADGTWRDLGLSVFGARQHGVTVMLPLEPERDYAPEFVSFGGTVYQSVIATPFTERADLATDPPQNAMAAMMNHARWHHNGVLLPDGTILAVGGGLYDNVIVHGQDNVPILPAELYDPATDSWTEVASMSVERMYHSTALLLPDGRVLAGGHVPLPNPFLVARDTVNPQVAETRLEIYEPPYLFRGERPVLWDVPRHVTYGQEFTVQVDPADGALDSLVLVSPGATTHSFDMNQRSIVLDWTAGNGTTVTVTAPPDGNVAPPGYYMVFANKAHPDGPIPSVAQWIHIT